MLPNREGRFKATILEHGVAETGPNNLATFICRFRLTQELGNGQWHPVDEDWDITGFFYLEQKNGSVNSVTIDSLKSAFQWDGRDPLWLQDTDFVASGHVVQIKLEYEQYNGQRKIKVRYVDAEDSDGRGLVPKADDAARRSLSMRLGSKLRALAGGTPVNTPPPAGKPAMVAPTPHRPKPQVQAPTQTQTQMQTQTPTQMPVATATTVTSAPAAASVDRPLNADTAWERFQTLFVKPEGSGGHVDPKLVEENWFSILGEMFVGRAHETLRPEEWSAFLAEAPGKIIPF